METPESVVALTKDNIDKAFNDEIQFIAEPVVEPIVEPNPGAMEQIQVPADPQVPATPPQQSVSIPQREYIHSIVKKYQLDQEGLEDYLKDMSPENADDKLIDFVSRNIDYDAFLERRIHPDLLKLQKQVDEGKPWNEVSSEAAQQSQFMNDNERVVAAVLKNEYNFDDDKISAHIAAYKDKGLLELEADKARSVIDNAQRQYQQRESALQESRKIEHEKTVNREVEETVQYFNTLPEIAGIPLSKADKDEFATYFKKISTPDKDGKVPIAEYLQSNKNLAKVAFLILKGDSKFKSQLTAAKESVKKTYEDKLYSEPPSRSASDRGRTPKEEALDAFSRD